MSTWILFVDESGDFAEAGDDVLVGGWVVRAYDTEQLDAALRAQLARVHPHVPYPPHASSLNVAAGHAAACELAGEPQTEEHRAIAASLAAAIAALRRCPLPEMATYRHSIEGRRVPDQKVLRKVDGWLARTHRPAWAALAKVRDDDEERRLELHRALAFGLAATESFAVGAFERGGHAQRAERPRYLALLGACLERVVALLAESTSPARPFLCVRVATRGFGEEGREGSLTLGEVEQAIDEARAAVGPPGKGMLAIARKPERYDSSVHPGIVIADMVVNRLRRAARRDVDWATLRDAAVLTTALPPEAMARSLGASAPLPALGADGRARAAVASGLTGRSTELFAADLEGERPPWVGEQAREWIHAARLGKP